MLDDHRTCSHGGTVTDLPTRNHPGADSNESAGADTNATGKCRRRGDVNGIAEHAIVVDRCVAVHDDEIAQHRAGVDHRTRHHHHAIAHAHRRGEVCARAHGADEPTSGSEHPPADRKADCVVTNSDQDLAGSCLNAGLKLALRAEDRHLKGRIRHAIPVQAPRNGPAKVREDVRTDPGMPAGPDEQHAHPTTTSTVGLSPRLAIMHTLDRLAATFRAEGQEDVQVAGQTGHTNPVPLVRRFGQAFVDLGCWGISLGFVYFILRHSTGAPFTAWDRAIVTLVVIGTHLPVALSLGLYQGRFWYGSSRESLRLYAAELAAALAGIIAALAVGTGKVGVVTVALAGPGSLCLGHIVRISLWLGRRRTIPNGEPTGRRLLVFGAGDGGELAIRSLLKSRSGQFTPVALLDDDPRKSRLEIEHIRVLGDRRNLAEVARVVDADALLIAIPSATSETIRELTAIAQAVGLEVFVLPGVDELLGAVSAGDIRPVTEADLLGRHPVDIDIDIIANFLSGRRVLVTGAGGSIGSELCRQIQRFAPGSLHMLDCDDSALHGVELSLEGRALLDDDRLVLADIRDPQAIRRAFERIRPEVVFHAAALKHLTLLERFPAEAWKTNVLGTQNVLDAAVATDVQHFVNISTDKAADPSSVLGWSKRITERQTAHAALACKRHFVSVRFGNVLGSRGSVLEIFEAQIREGGPLTVTDENVTRFFMTVTEAVRLTMNAAAVGTGGEVLILDMGTPVRILDVAERLAGASPRPISIEITGLRPGEKLHETLHGTDESADRPIHPKISHAGVPVLDLRAITQPSDLEVTAQDLQRIATLPAPTVTQIQ